jgi:glycosyltransferase involved in cell wall biosynthesis
LRKATGELIAFIDSDDLWHPSKLEKQVAAFQQHPEAGFSLTGGYNFRKPGEAAAYFYKQREGFTYGDLLIPFFKSEIAAIAPSLLFRKECLETTGLLNEAKYFAETDFMLNLAKHFKGIVLYEPLLFRRLHKDNISAEKWEQGYQEGIDLIRDFKSSLPPGLAADALLRLHINAGEKYLSYGQPKKAIRQFLTALKSKPASLVPLKKTIKAFRKLLTK